MCEYINTHEELIHITTFQEYRDVMRKVMKIIKEEHNLERKRRHISKKKSEEAKERTQKAKTLVIRVQRAELRKDDIVVKDSDLREGQRTRDRKGNDKRECCREDRGNFQKRRAVGDLGEDEGRSQEEAKK